jgi:hypothetical protein
MRAGAGEALASAAVSTPAVGGPVISGNGGSVTLQIDTIDARGATMTEEQYRAITGEVLNDLLSRGRASLLAG